ncbi:MAG: hypothetical protein AAGF45_07890 [Pseudomonadota bacterium]
MGPLRFIVIALGLTAGWSFANAQSFQTALPVSPAERRAIETRLSTILDYSAPDEISEFDLPSGRSVIVRPYQMVRRHSGPPCRGYRLDLVGANGRTAVDGFRCRRSDGSAWVIVEPELVLTREEGPLNLRDLDDPFSPESRGPDEPIYPADEPVFEPRRAAAPIPRPAPRRPFDTPADPGQATEPQIVTQDIPQFTPQEPVNETGDEPGETTARDAVAPEVVADDADDPADAPIGNVEGGAQVLASVREEPSRVVGRPERVARAVFSADEDIVGALRDLGYLPQDAEPTEPAVTAAIDDFALDERFALPVAPDALLQRLDDAVERSAGLPLCGPGTPAEPCLQDG